MSHNHEAPDAPDPQQLLTELGTLGVRNLTIGVEAGDTTRIFASAPVDPAERGFDQYRYGESTLLFGYGLRGFPFAYHEVTDWRKPVERHVAVGEWDPSLIATDRTWEIVRELNSPTMVGGHSIPRLGPIKTKRLRNLSGLFADTDEDRMVAAKLQETIEQVRGWGVDQLIIKHAGGLATGHRVEAEWRDLSAPPILARQGVAVDQAGSHFWLELGLRGPKYEPAIATTHLPGEHGYGLDIISDLTFNRMPTNSSVKINFTGPEQAITP